jgi:hypothetical protein
MSVTGQDWQQQGLFCVTTVYLMGCTAPKDTADMLRKELRCEPLDAYIGVDALPRNGVVSVRMICSTGRSYNQQIQLIAKISRKALISAESADRPK